MISDLLYDIGDLQYDIDLMHMTSEGTTSLANGPRPPF